MKILKIENKKSYFSTDGSNYTSITDIGKEDIYKILDIIYNNNDYEMDEYNDSVEIANEVEKIIYKDIYNQLISFASKKEILASEINNEFKTVKEKYQIEAE
ncbi:MAG: hypothetical protein J6A89_01910 [Clostridia bacterium]|nr:hypothetical protein [Clostridia bacterium]